MGSFCILGRQFDSIPKQTEISAVCKDKQSPTGTQVKKGDQSMLCVREREREGRKEEGKRRRRERERKYE